MELELKGNTEKVQNKSKYVLESQEQLYFWECILRKYLNIHMSPSPQKDKAMNIMVLTATVFGITEN